LQYESSKSSYQTISEPAKNVDWRLTTSFFAIKWYFKNNDIIITRRAYRMHSLEFIG